VRSATITSWIHDLRRAGTQSGVRAALAISKRFGPAGAIRLGAALGVAARWSPIRRRLAANLRAAGIEPTRAILDSYFERFGRWAGWSLAVYQWGFDSSGMGDRFLFDESIANLDRAVAAGRGVILAAPHDFCHEIAAAAIHRRHRVTALVRESKSAAREAMKQRWYAATGLNTIRRPRHASAVADIRAYLRLLRDGRVFAITPDLLAAPGHGVPVRAFGREIHLAPGFAVLALRTGASVVVVEGEYPPGNLRLHFSEPVTVTAGDDKDVAIQSAVQRFWSSLEGSLRRHPENWMFWLDKRWARALHAGGTAA
jgi:lauroyl/myristoyl acyltransferase